MGSNEGALFLSSRGSNPLKADWRTHVLASSGYLEVGMFDAAALVLEEIAPEDKTRTRCWAHASTSTWQPGNATWSWRLPAIW